MVRSFQSFMIWLGISRAERLWGMFTPNLLEPRGSTRPLGVRVNVARRTDRGQNMAYHLEGRLLEVCNCRVLCPCWIGEDPDNGTCDTIVGWHFDKGTVNGVDVSGRTVVALAHVPGNILKGNWRAAV